MLETEKVTVSKKKLLQGYNSKRYMHTSVSSSSLHNREDMELSIDRQMDKEDVVHIYNGILLSHKKNEIMSSAAP